MIKRVGLAVCLALGLSAAAHAREVEGVEVPDRTLVGQHNLILNGAGVRTRFLVKAYVGALYLPTPTHDGGAAIAADLPKRITIVLLRDLSKHQVVSALREGFEANVTPERLRELGPRIQKFEDFLRDAKRGQWMMLTYEPGKGIVATDSVGDFMVIPGKDFADALFSVWLGPHPADDGLKKAMLSPPGAS